MSHETLLFLSFMIPGTFFLGAYDVLNKRLLKNGYSEGLVLGLVMLLSGCLLLIVGAIVGLPTLRPGFWFAFIMTTALNVVSQWIWTLALNRGDASLISPLRLLTPPLVLITGFFILGEIPKIGGVIGVVTIIFGLLLLFKSQSVFNKESLKTLVFRPAVLYGLFAAFLFALSLPFDKKVAQTSSALFLSGTVFSIIGVVHLILLRRRLGRQKQEPLSLSVFGSFALVAAILAASQFLNTQALLYGLAAYVASLKRLSVLWAVVLSGVLLAEKNIGWKLAATATMIVGALITLYFG